MHIKKSFIVQIFGKKKNCCSSMCNLKDFLENIYIEKQKTKNL